MKWLKDLPIDIDTLLYHIKAFLSYIGNDLKEIIKDIFTISK